MSKVNLQQNMADMRAQALGYKPEPVRAEGSEFAGMLKQAVEGVNRQQLDASRLSDAFGRGENVPLSDVMVSMQKAKVSFEAVKQVRNHLLEAYREVSRMQI